MPYDLCPATYSGIDADMIILEQSYNCGFGDNENRIHEQFIRLAMQMPNQPVIAIADSSSPNFGENDCKDKPTDPPAIDENGKKRLEALKSNKKSISTELNHVNLGGLGDLQRIYKAAGVQLW